MVAMLPLYVLALLPAYIAALSIPSVPDRSDRVEKRLWTFNDSITAMLGRPRPEYEEEWLEGSEDGIATYQRRDGPIMLVNHTSGENTTLISHDTVSYTHLTLPTKRIV